MKFLIATILLVLQVICIESAPVHQGVQLYFWRDFNGLVPWDAIEGGKNKNGENTFIGQFHIPKGGIVVTVPAIITKGSPKARAAYHGVSTSNKDSDLKILCAEYYEDYKWLSQSSQVFPRCHYVHGGFGNDVPYYIGRATIDNQVLVGKIESKKFPLILRVPKDDGQEPAITEFEILTFCY